MVYNSNGRVVVHLYDHGPRTAVRAYYCHNASIKFCDNFRNKKNKTKQKANTGRGQRPLLRCRRQVGTVRDLCTRRKTLFGADCFIPIIFFFFFPPHIRFYIISYTNRLENQWRWRWCTLFYLCGQRDPGPPTAWYKTIINNFRGSPGALPLPKPPSSS